MTALRGYIQGQNTGRNTSLAWPSGTAVGDLCWLYTGGDLPQSGPQSSGWTPVGHKAWWKILDATDIAGPLVVTAERIKAAVFLGADRIGNVSAQASVKVGAGDWMIVDASRRSSPVVSDATWRIGNEWVSTTGNVQATLGRAASTSGTLMIPVNSGVEAFAYQVVSEALPAAPALSAPSALQRFSTLDLVRFAWRNRGGTLRYSIVELVGPMGTRTLKDDGTLYNGTWNLAPTEAITLAAGLAAGTYTWRARTENYTGQGPWASPAVTFYVDVPPSIGTITVTSPFGSVTPRVVASATAGYGAIEQTRVTIAPATSTNPQQEAVWTSGVQLGSGVDETGAADAPWINGQSLRAWVTVWQTGGVSTTTVSAPFTVSWTPTAAPVVTLTAGSPPRVNLSGITPWNKVQVEQQIGGVWGPLVTTEVALTQVSFGSPMLAIGEPVKVRARQATQVSGAWLWSDWVETPTQTLPPVGCFLVDDANRSVYTVAHLHEEGAREIVQGITTTYGLGASEARIDYSVQAGLSGEMTLAARSTYNAGLIKEWLSNRTVWWFIFPPEGVGTLYPQRPVRMRRTSPVIEVRAAQSARLPDRFYPISWVESPEK